MHIKYKAGVGDQGSNSSLVSGLTPAGIRPPVPFFSLDSLQITDSWNNSCQDGLPGVSSPSPAQEGMPAKTEEVAQVLKFQASKDGDHTFTSRLGAPILKFSFSLTFIEIPAGCVCSLMSFAVHLHQEPAPPTPQPPSRTAGASLSLLFSPPNHLSTLSLPLSTAPSCSSPQSRHSTSDVIPSLRLLPVPLPAQPCWPAETPELPPALAGHQELTLVTLPQMQNYFSPCFSPERSDGQKCTESSQETRTNSRGCLSLPCCSHPVSWRFWAFQSSYSVRLS